MLEIEKIENAIKKESECENLKIECKKDGNIKNINKKIK